MVMEQTWEAYKTPSPCRLSGIKNRVRRGVHPDPGGLFSGGKRTGEKFFGWLWIGLVSNPSAELSRTSPSHPHAFFSLCRHL